MTGKEALEALKAYKHIEGKSYMYKGKIWVFSKAVVGPSNLDEWAANYSEYYARNEETVLMGLSTSYDIYFLPKGAESPLKFFVNRYNFDNLCKEIIG